MAQNLFVAFAFAANEINDKHHFFRCLKRFELSQIFKLFVSYVELMTKQQKCGICQ